MSEEAWFIDLSKYFKWDPFSSWEHIIQLIFTDERARDKSIIKFTIDAEIITSMNLSGEWRDLIKVGFIFDSC